MTDNEIIKALEDKTHKAEYSWVDSSYCDVEVSLLKNALDLINRQQAEIEKLQNLKTFENFIIRRIHGIGTKYECDFATKEARDEAFEKELNKLFDIATARAEAIKEFAERFINLIHTHQYILCDKHNSKDYGMFTNGIEQAVNETKKEMAGDTE